MLALTVKVGERVKVVLPDGRVGYLTVAETTRAGAKLLFELPRDVGLFRQSVADAAFEERQKAMAERKALGVE